MSKSVDKPPQKKTTNKFVGLEISDSDDSSSCDDDKKINKETNATNNTNTTNKITSAQTEVSREQTHMSKKEGGVYVARVLKERGEKNCDNGDDKWDNQYKKNKQRKYVTDTENKQLYVENLEVSNELGNNKYFNSPWTVWIHKSDCTSWTEDSYTNAYMINNIGSFWRFFNNFQLIDKVKNQIFIFRNKIKPIWEDNENRNGGICSIKIDCHNRLGKYDIGSITMSCISLLVMNETFIQNCDEINGISYSIKNRSIFIKLWCKNYNTKITEKLPLGFLNKLDSLLESQEKFSYNKKQDSKYDSKISIRYTQIKPEYEIPS